MTQPTANVVIDARELEAPEPFVRTMEALDVLPDGHRLATAGEGSSAHLARRFNRGAAAEGAYASSGDGRRRSA